VTRATALFQSFPMLIIFGVEADDTTPRVKIDGGRYQLVEPQFTLDSYPVGFRWTRWALV